MSGYSGDPMLEMYIFETSQNLEQLEAAILSSEEAKCFTEAAINEIFRIMHTIKGSSAMMMFENVAVLAHRLEDLFYLLRESAANHLDCAVLSDLLLSGVDFIKLELHKIEAGEQADGDSAPLIAEIEELLMQLKLRTATVGDVSEGKEAQHYYIPALKTDKAPRGSVYRATLFFEPDCQMVNIRAFMVVHSLKEFADEVYHLPADITENDASAELIAAQGFTIVTRVGRSYEQMQQFFLDTSFLSRLELEQLEDDHELQGFAQDPTLTPEALLDEPPGASAEQLANYQATPKVAVSQSLISVDVTKLDKLMDLMGEMVIAEAMVTQNPDLQGLDLRNFGKAARQLRKITGELQDTVMAMRMVPLAATFQKMHRVVRDMSRKLGKEVQLTLLGEETEVDKNIIEHISDPLMHLIRNAVDHGIEATEKRVAGGKARVGNIALEAKNAGGDVLVIVRDDGGGLDRQKILRRAKDSDLLSKSEEEMTDREVYNLIFLPGFSTQDAVTEFSGRGVGMDVVVRNLEKIGGMAMVDSLPGQGTTVTLKIPLTLAIIDGMNVKVGDARYTIPITSIQQSFRPLPRDLVIDPDGNEMVMVRGNCYPIIRLHRYFGVRTEVMSYDQGILIMVEQDDSSFCLFADELLGQQQVVVKALPSYIREAKRIGGLAGCTLLGDGSISLILDVAGIGDFARKEVGA